MNIKPMPHNLEAEQAVICALLINKEYAAPKAQAILEPEDFYQDRHGILFRELCNGTPADLVSLKQSLTEKKLLEKAGGEQYLKELVFSAITSAGVEHHARIVKDMSRRRRLGNLGIQVSDTSNDLTTPWDDILSGVKLNLRKIEEGEALALDDKSLSNKSLYNRVWNDLWNEKGEPGLSLGVEALEEKHYLEKGCTHVVAAESGTGKSAFCLQVADHVSQKYGTSLYFSLESTREKLAIRQIARKAKVALTRLHKHHLDRADDADRISSAISALIRQPLILIDDTRYQEVEKLCSFCESFAMNQRVHLIVVDFLQLMGCRDRQQNRHLEISYVMKRLCFLAKAVGCPVIVVSQLGKDVEKRGNRRPTLGDLKESGDIRTQADNILFLYAPDPEPTVYQVECFLGKGKDQEQFSQWLEFNGNYQEFTEGCKPDIIKHSRSHWQEKQ